MKSRMRRTVADYRKLPAETVVRRRSNKPRIAHRITTNAPDHRNGSKSAVPMTLRQGLPLGGKADVIR